jgi:phospholipid/cholesterol/gamma-HCH transport system substrate-binding protein
MADYNTLQRKRNMIVGGFVVVALCAFLYMVYKFQDLPVVVGKLRSFQIMVNFPNAPGAQKNTPVQYCGYQVGRVTNVSPPFLYEDRDGRGYHQIKITIAIEKKYVDIPSNVNILLMRRGLGSSYIDLQVDPQKSLEPMDPAEPRSMYLMEGMVLAGSTGMASEFFPKDVQNKIESLVDAVSALANNINDILGDPDNKANIKQTLANVNTLTVQATKTFESIQTFSDAGTGAVENTADRLDATLTELQMVLAKVNTGQGTAARVLNDGRLYENLLDSSEELKLSLEQLRIFVNDINEKGVGVNIKLW